MRTPFIDQVHANPRSWIIPTEPNRMEMDRVGNDDRYFPPAASMNLPRPSYHQPIPNPFDRQFSLHAEIDHTSSHRDGRPERSGRYARLDGAVDEYPFQPAVQGQFSRSGQVETGFEVAPPAPSPTSSTATAEELDIPTRIGATVSPSPLLPSSLADIVPEIDSRSLRNFISPSNIPSNLATYFSGLDRAIHSSFVSRIRD